MCHLGTPVSLQVNGECGSVGSKVGLDDLRGPFRHKQCYVSIHNSSVLLLCSSGE